MNRRSFEQVRMKEPPYEHPSKPPTLLDEQIELVRRVAEMLRAFSRFDSGRDENVDQGC